MANLPLDINTTGGDNVAIGRNALGVDTTGNNNTAVGSGALPSATGSNNTAVGKGAGFGVTTGTQNVFIGDNSGSGMATGIRNVVIGTTAGPAFTDANNLIAIGYQAGAGLFAAPSQSVLIGTDAGGAAKDGCVMIGYQAGSAEFGSNKLYIDNSATGAPLIYGDFATNLLRVNGTLNVNSAFSFPTADGSNGQFLKTNGTGTLSWAAESQDLTLSGNTLAVSSDPNTDVDLSGYLDNTDAQALTVANDSISISGGNQVALALSMMHDADNNTKVQVEKTANDNIIRFDINGTEVWSMQSNRLSNADTTLLIGRHAGEVITPQRIAIQPLGTSPFKPSVQETTIQVLVVTPLGP